MDTGREFVAGRNSLQQSSQCGTLRRIQPEAYRFVVSSRHLAELPSTVLLIPLTRFRGLVWIIAVGFALPATTKWLSAASAQTTS